MLYICIVNISELTLFGVFSYPVVRLDMEYVK